jgi:hypothetical protein
MRENNSHARFRKLCIKMNNKALITRNLIFSYNRLVAFTFPDIDCAPGITASSWGRRAVEKQPFCTLSPDY